MLPGTGTLVATVAALCATLAAEAAIMPGAAAGSAWLPRAGMHVGVGVAALAVWLAAAYRSEREALAQAMQLRKSKAE
jgi:hypothetical protein